MMYTAISITLKTGIEPHTHLYFVQTDNWKGNVYLKMDTPHKSADFRNAPIAQNLK